MRQSSHNWALRYGRDVFKADDWKSVLSQIKELDFECSRLAGEIGQEELDAGMKEKSAKIDDLLQSWNVGFQVLQEQGTNTYLAVDAHARENRNWRDKDETRKLLQALRAKNPYRDQLERTASRQPGTCNWFLKHPQFQKWREDAHSRLLWVSANPGCGKSVLSKCLVEENLAILDPQHATICYFFFKDVSPDSRSISKAISAILHQLFTKIPGLVEHAVPAFDENGDELPSMFSTLWEVLEKAAADIRSGEVVCILDALDECEETQQIILIEKLKAFYCRAEDSRFRTQKLRFLLTSRPYRNIRARFHSLIQQFPTIHLSGDDESDHIREEIDLVIRSEVSAIASERYFSSETEDFLLKQLLSIENRTYLWLHLILDQIRNSDNAGHEKAIQKEIQTIPQSVSRAYEAILAKAKDKKLASKLLHIIVGAETALTLQDLNVAMSIEDDSRCYADLELENATAFELRIKSICGLFVYTDRARVFLIHQTAKEFLRWNQEVSEPHAGMWEHSLRPEESNSLLAGICVSLLMFEDFETDSLSAEGLDYPVSTVQFEQYCDAHALLRYAAEWWPEHLKSSPVEQQKALVQKTAHLCNIRSRRCWTWLRVKRLAEDGYQPSGFTDLILASELGLAALVKHLMPTGIDINAKDNEGASALNRAVVTGHHEVVKILLDNGADIEAGGWDPPWREQISENGSEREVKPFSGRPLILASMENDYIMMRMLLTAGADSEAREGDDILPLMTALHRATLFGGDATMRILLENGADVNARMEHRGYQQKMPPWILLKKFGRDSFVHGIAFELVSVVHTALEIGILADDAAKVALLLEYGADPQAEVASDDQKYENESSSPHSDNSGGSNSSAVCDRDGQDIGRAGEDSEHISTTGSDRAEPFEDNDCSGSQAASGNEVEDHSQVKGELVVNEMSSDNVIAISDDGTCVETDFDGKLPPECILEQWELATKAITRMTVLHMAASRGDKNVVRALLQYGAHKTLVPTTPSEPTALHLAALLGNSQVVKLLTDQSMNVNPTDHNGETPLHLAVWCGYDRVVNELLEHGGDTNARDNDGATPLHVAVDMEHRFMATDLLDYGADVHVEDNAGLSPLLLAIRRGYDQAVTKFILYGARLNTKNDDGMTALHMAALQGHELIARELLVHEVDLNIKNRDEHTALHLAAREGHTRVVKRLLKFGADPNARNIDKAVPLHLAAKGGHDSTVKKLLVHGVVLNAKNGDEHTALHLAASEGRTRVVKRLLKFGADVNARNRDENTPLHLAAAKGNARVVRQLLNHDADVSAKDKDGETPLHWAAIVGDTRVVSQLLNHDADVNARNREQRTPLHEAVAFGRGQVVAQLLDHGADFRCQTMAGNTALDLATNQHQQEVISLLLARYPQDSDERRRFRARDPEELGTDDDGKLD